MTREEAYNRIDVIIAKYEIDDEYVTITNFMDYDALRLARKLLEQESCEDAISRQAVKEQMIKYGFHAPDITVTEFVVDLPPVKPQEKTGYWIYKQYDGYPECGNYHCSECDKIDNHIPSYCPHCGCAMIEPQERSEE